MQSNMGLLTEYTRSNMQGKISGAECIVRDMGGVNSENEKCLYSRILFV